MPEPLRRRPRGPVGGDGRAGVPWAQEEARRRVRRGRLTLIVVVLVVTVALGVAISFYGPPSALNPSRSGSTSGSTSHVLGVVLVVVGLLTVVAAGVRARRAGALRLAWNSPTATIPRKRRRSLLARVRHDRPVAQEEQEDASAVADSLVRQVAMVPVYGGFAVYVLGQSLLASAPFGRWIELAAAVVMIAALPFVVRDAQRAGRWLANHASPVD